ncbi:MAG TPA: peptidoglycan-binding protein LysM, partial [Pseudomonas sp.]|nr:peptidoglycan-binding protein LysM [Pseudomonas sp.]
MTPVRHLLLGLASSSALYSGVVPALGLGEITLHSALNQPLDAEIELLEVGDLTSSDVLVRLASAEVFSRSGVDRLFFLNDLRFTPILRGSNSVIRVVSNRPVNEPYLNFIVEVARPNGQLLREYTVLLDPPGSSAYRTMASVPS